MCRADCGITAAAAVVRRRGRAQSPDARIDAVFASTTAPRRDARLRSAARAPSWPRRRTGWPTSSTTSRLRPDTIFEAGSVSKQFTAAAILLLAQEGKLSLDDPARKYIPELPDYGAPLTIRHMLTHTSGLRDWGSVASHRRVAARHARAHPRARARHRQPAAVAELSIGHRYPTATPATTWPRSSSRASAAVVHRVHARRGSSSRSA